MIGVIADPAEHDVVREFFELFKTPWELYRSHRQYDVVLCAGQGRVAPAAARLVLVYAGDTLGLDAEAAALVDAEHENAMLCYGERQLPIYGASLGFRSGDGIVTHDVSGQAATCVVSSRGGTVVRLGYDLFREIRALLTVGQPPANAGIPTLDTHIALLRDLIVAWAPPLVEIPPVPGGHRFVACLTHDVDHPSIRRHALDHTMAGFLSRAVLGSLLSVLRGRAPARSLLTNWTAALKLPLVHLGLARDFWADFDRYLDLEAGLASTFFVIPFADDPGRLAGGGQAPPRRAARYGARDIAGTIRRLMAAGGEIGLHGIDAWRDSARGRDELEELARITGEREMGVRMHWLYGDAASPAVLEKAGFAFDSTAGYNGTVGYRAGTTQVFKPLDAVRLLELPLHVMDTALFYPCHLGLSARQAHTRVRAIIDHALRAGGTITVNWHDRSLAPERLWGDSYVRLIDDLERADAWFATAGQAVEWFRRRRSAAFDGVRIDAGILKTKVTAECGEGLPGLRLRVHTTPGEAGYADHAITHGSDIHARI